jgi:hypothetical protein
MSHAERDLAVSAPNAMGVTADSQSVALMLDALSACSILGHKQRHASCVG